MPLILHPFKDLRVLSTLPGGPILTRREASSPSISQANPMPHPTSDSWEANSEMDLWAENIWGVPLGLMLWGREWSRIGISFPSLPLSQKKEKKESAQFEAGSFWIKDVGSPGVCERCQLPGNSSLLLLSHSLLLSLEEKEQRQASFYINGEEKIPCTPTSLPWMVWCLSEEIGDGVWVHCGFKLSTCRVQGSWNNGNWLESTILLIKKEQEKII